jgi:hypothetical protein
MVPSKYTPEQIAKLKQAAASFLIRQDVFQKHATDEKKVIAALMADHTEEIK